MRYPWFFVIASGLILAVDVVGASAAGAGSFMTRQLCGPVGAWIIALLLPVETIQNRLVKAIEGKG